MTFQCRASGEPLPHVSWLKNDNPLSEKQLLTKKYEMEGDGIRLTVSDINFSDTGAFMCQAKNKGGKKIDISSLVVMNEESSYVSGMKFHLPFHSERKD